MSNEKRVILAPTGVGKTYASNVLPDKIKDIDWALYMRTKTKNADGSITRVRKTDFPVRWVRECADALETHSTVTCPLIFGIGVGDLINLVLSNKGDRTAIRQFVKEVVQKNAVECGESVTEVSHAQEIDNLTEQIIPELQRLKKHNIEPVITVPDLDCRDMIHKHIQLRTQAGTEGHKSAGKERDDEILDLMLAEGNKLLATGKWSKLSMHAGQTFLDAFQQNEIEKSGKVLDVGKG